MTTPNQIAPDGSYVIGGGTWGQDLNEQMVWQIIRPLPSLGDAADDLRELLSRIPLDALKVFQPFINAADDLFDNVGSAVQAIIDALLNSPVWMSLAAFGEWVGSAFDPIKDLANAAHEYIQQLFGMVGDIVVNFVEGWGEFLEDLNITGVFNTSASIQSAITNLQTLINQIAAGGGITENFTSYPDGAPGPKWSCWHSGNNSSVIKVVKGRLTLPDPQIFTGRTGWARYAAAPTKTDYQKIGVAFGSRMQTSIVGTSAENYILGRVNTTDSPATCSLVYVKLENSGAEIGYRLNGVDTVIKAFPGFRFNLSSSYWLECGVPGANGGAGSPRTYRLWENNIPIFEAVDGSGKSPLGAANRHGGVGFHNPALQSASVASFAMYDNT